MEEQQFYQIKACPTINGGRQEEVHCADSAVTEGYDRARIVFQEKLEIMCTFTVDSYSSKMFSRNILIQFYPIQCVVPR